MEALNTALLFGRKSIFNSSYSCLFKNIKEDSSDLDPWKFLAFLFLHRQRTAFVLSLVRLFQSSIVLLNKSQRGLGIVQNITSTW